VDPRPRATQLFVAAYRCYHLAQDEAQRATQVLRGDVVEGIALLVAIVQMLDRDQNMETARSAALDFWYHHRDAAVAQLEPLAADSERWYALLGAVAEIWASREPSLAAAMTRLSATRRRGPSPMRDWVRDDVEQTGERFKALLRSPDERERLAAAWCMNEVTSWVVGFCEELMEDDAIAAWEHMVALARSDISDDDLRTFGAGAPENLLEDHAELVIERVESDARSDARVRLMLSGAWQTSRMDDALWARVEKTLGEYREGPRDNAGQSPLLQYMREQEIWRGMRHPGGRKRLESLIGEVKDSYTIDEVARIVGRTTQDVKADVESGALILIGPPFAQVVPLASVVTCYFPELFRAKPGSN
jgi:hypothetical protein